LPVLPCNPLPAKRPLLGDGWQQAATRDVATITAWWTKWPLAMVAVPTGAASGIVAVNLANGGGLKTWAELAGGDVVGGTRTHGTPGGGRHLLYKHEKGIRNNTVLAPGVTIKSDNGYAVFPPSLTEDCRAYTVIEDVAIAAMPPWLRQRLQLQAPEPDVLAAAAALIKRRGWDLLLVSLYADAEGKVQKKPLVAGQGGARRQMGRHPIP
jgi:hypothetical protein